MSETDKKPDQEKGDEVLRQMLNTPPDPKIKQKNEQGPKRQDSSFDKPE